MTFWQDARPATPRFRRDRPRPRHRPPRRGRGSRLTRNLVVGVVTVAVVAAVTVLRSSPDADARPVARSRDHGAARSRSTPRRILPAWSGPAVDWPRALFPSGGDVIAVADHHVRSYRIADGTRRWATEVPRPGERPAVRGPTVLLATDRELVALDSGTGKIRWQVGSPEPPGSVALVGDDLSNQIAVGATERGALVGVDARTGEPKWSVRYPGAVRGPIAVDSGTGAVVAVWSTAGDGCVLRVVDGATGARRWEQPLMGGAGAPAVAAGTVVVSSGDDRPGALQAFALADGRERWRTRVGAPSQPDLVPLVDGGDVFAVDQDGTVVRVRLADGHRMWSTATHALTVFARPVRIGRAILLWNESGELLTLDRAAGAIRARRRTAGVAIGLVVGEGRVVIGQRMIRGAPVQAFPATALAAPARDRR